MTVLPRNDYPDLTAAPVVSVDSLAERARQDMQPKLDASRAAPASGEPADSLRFLGTPGRLHADVVHGRPQRIVKAPLDKRPSFDLGVGELLDAFAAGTLTPSQLLEDLAPRWSADGPAPQAVLALVPGTDAAAAISDERWKSGTARPLEGIPFAVKDIIDVVGAQVTCGSLLTGDRIAKADATVITRLRAVGAIPVFMSATSEFACGAPENVRYGPVPNPWNAERWTGGSSTGSAAALAARLVPFALGTDTGGSIRVPSGQCGLTGIKPTYGLVSRTGVASLSWTLDHVGVMARSAADVMLVLPYVAGPDPCDSSMLPRSTAVDAIEMVFAGNVLRDLRIGTVTEWFTDVCDHGVIDAWRAAVVTLAGAGCIVTAASVGDVSRLHDDAAVILATELASHQEGNLDRFHMFDTGTQVRIARGQVPSATDYLRSLRKRASAQQEALELWNRLEIDFVVTPGVGATGAHLSDATSEVNGERIPLQAMISRNTAVFDYLGFPAVAVPAGLVDGLPVGFQIVGRPGTDLLCLQIAEAFQKLTDFHTASPDE